MTHKDRSEDRCPECDAEDWSDVKFWIDGAEGRMCWTCRHIEHRCHTGHWRDAAIFLDARGFCPPCVERRAR